ncbi:hypothetical protein [Granulicatella seriolae]|uniref:Uncharacterized protein n=1 Tax=Granulicatella seriolae TaxID=2967226 RepID=A0ABT1WQ61_9LACT|nr:hypothetical protein [Granulicatella seriolae]
MTEVKNKGGRPPTGLNRTKMLGNRYTIEEVEEIREIARTANMTITDAILQALRNEFKKTK